jgi:hypothetical protein
MDEVHKPNVSDKISGINELDMAICTVHVSLSSKI